MPLLTHIDHVVTGIRYKPANVFRPQRCRHTGGVASPVEATEDRAFQPQSVSKLDDVLATGSLLSASHGAVRDEAGCAEPASVWGDDPRSCCRQDRSDFIKGMHVIGEAVRQDNRPAISWPIFDIGDTQDVGLDASHWVLSHGRPSPATVETNAHRSASISSGCSKAAGGPSPSQLGTGERRKLTS